METVPEFGSSIPERTFSNVVLPHPEGPIIATIDPESIEIETS